MITKMSATQSCIKLTCTMLPLRAFELKLRTGSDWFRWLLRIYLTTEMTINPGGVRAKRIHALKFHTVIVHTVLQSLPNPKGWKPASSMQARDVEHTGLLSHAEPYNHILTSCNDK